MAECSSGEILADHPTFEKSHSKVPLVSRRACARPRDLFLPSIAIDRRSSTPLHTQLGRQIARAIRNGVPAGSRLPSSRVMARLLGVSRNTVMTAYDDLVAGGLICGRRGAGMLVAARGAEMPMLDPQRVLREAQYPVRTLRIVDPDGLELYLAYR
jgi:DNA-binding transcriptional regulator YhcF (GntR family)